MIPYKSKMKKQETDKIVLHICHVRPFWTNSFVIPLTHGQTAPRL